MKVPAASTGAEVSPRFAARLAGFGYLAIFVLAIFANFFVLEGVVESGDASATVANIAESEGLFRAGLISFLIVFALDVAVAWALFIYFRDVSRDWSLVTAWFRLIYTAFLGVGLIFFFLVLQLVEGGESVAALEAGERDAQVMLYLDAFDFAWLIGLACFGIHLVLLAYLAVRSGFIPKAIGALLAIAGGAYVLDTAAHGLLSNYEDYESIFLTIVVVPSVIGEMALALWLLIRGSKKDRQAMHLGARARSSRQALSH